MTKVQFVNFVAFGKRNSIDLRVVVVTGRGAPVHYHVGEEIPQNGSPSSIIAGFNELASSLFSDLVVELGSSGETQLIEVLVSLKDECEGEAYAEHGVSCEGSTFRMWVSFFASLNETEIKITE